MGPAQGIIEALHWVTFLFPSFSEYAGILTPILLFMVSAIGVFSNLLPTPGKVYMVPYTSDIESELKGRSRIVYHLTQFARRVTIVMNGVICSKPYKYFYISTVFFSNLLKRIKGEKSKSSNIVITKPEPYEIDVDRLKNIGHDNDNK